MLIRQLFHLWVRVNRQQDVRQSLSPNRLAIPSPLNRCLYLCSKTRASAERRSISRWLWCAAKSWIWPRHSRIARVPCNWYRCPQFWWSGKLRDGGWWRRMKAQVKAMWADSGMGTVCVFMCSGQWNGDAQFCPLCSFRCRVREPQKFGFRQQFQNKSPIFSWCW